MSLFNTPSIYAPALIRSGWVKWLQPHRFTHLITLSFCSAQNFIPHAQGRILLDERFRLGKRYFRRLQQRILKRIKNVEDKFIYFGFMENLSRLGNSTYPHLHVLVRIPSELVGRFNRYYRCLWE
jgi:hypothetical protein